MELKQLKYFAEVARGEHVTRAAEKLHVAQSAISRQISNLEEELGVSLFVREGRNVKLTPFGKIFLNRAEKAIAEIEKGIQEAKQYLDPESGEIRLGFPHSMAAKMLPSVISEFRKFHPKINFHLQVGPVVELVEEVIKGEIDIAFVAPVPTKHPLVEGHILFTEDVMAILPPKHPLAGKKSIHLSQLKNDPFVLFSLGLAMRRIVMEAFEQAGFSPRIAFEGEETETIRGLVSAGLGVGLLPEVAITGEFDDSHVRISEPPMTRTVGFVIPRDRKLSPAEVLFRDFLYTF